MAVVHFNPFNIKLVAATLLLTIGTAQFYWLCSVKSFPIDIALTDALGSYLLLFGIFLILDYGISPYMPAITRFSIVAMQSLGLTVIWILVAQWSLLNLFENRSYEIFWKETIYIRGLIGWILLFDYTLVNYFIKHLSRQESVAEKEQYTIRLKKEAELFKLRQQLHPHFLFNSLNSINALIGKEPQRARQMVQQVSDFLRNTLKKEDNDLILIRKELEDLRLYLSIEQVRFGHRLIVEEHIDDDCLDFKIPPFLLQPLVENAIKYGLYGTTGIVQIRLEGILSANQFCFTIKNPYDPDAVATKGTGFGLESVRRRLYLLFARNDLLQLQNDRTINVDGVEMGAFSARICVPVDEDLGA